MSANRHPVDVLADIRAEIKALQEQEAVVKQRVIASLGQLLPGESQTVAGDEFVASVSLSSRETLDRKEVEKLLSRPKLQSCLKSSTAITVRTTPRDHRQEAA